jgi:MtN3 and saliva related transmembrane protein
MEYIGIIAASITSFASIPQLVKTWRTKKANDLSYGMLVFLVIGISLWLVYGFLIGAFPVILESVISLSSILGILILKIIYERKND